LEDKGVDGKILLKRTVHWIFLAQDRDKKKDSCKCGELLTGYSLKVRQEVPTALL
jgi:hypothetical protein